VEALQIEPVVDDHRARDAHALACEVGADRLRHADARGDAAGTQALDHGVAEQALLVHDARDTGPARGEHDVEVLQEAVAGVDHVGPLPAEHRQQHARPRDLLPHQAPRRAERAPRLRAPPRATVSQTAAGRGPVDRPGVEGEDAAVRPVEHGTQILRLVENERRPVALRIEAADQVDEPVSAPPTVPVWL
jgi:hypothetical protein